MIHSFPRKAISDKSYATQLNELFTINLSQICTEFYQGRLISAALKLCICSCFFWHTILQFLILYESQTQPIPSTEMRNWTTVTARNWVQIHHLITCTVLLQLTHNANNNNGYSLKALNALCRKIWKGREKGVIIHTNKNYLSLHNFNDNNNKKTYVVHTLPSPSPSPIRTQSSHMHTYIQSSCIHTHTHTTHACMHIMHAHTQQI